MRFGLFGGASARRGLPVAESARGYHDVVEYHIEAEALGYHSSFVTEHHFTAIGQVSATSDPADLDRGAHPHVAARHRGHRLAVAQPGITGRTGGDPRSAVRRPARFRRRQGLPAQRIRRLRDAARGGREPVRGSVGRAGPGARVRPALFPSRALLAVRQYRRRAAAGAAAAPAAMDGGEQRRIDPRLRPARRQPAARPVRRAGIDRASASRFTGANWRRPGINTIRAGSRWRAISGSRPMPPTRRRRCAGRRRQNERLLALSRGPASRPSSHILGYSDEPGARSARPIGTPDELGEKLAAPRAVGVDYVLLSGQGSRGTTARLSPRWRSCRPSRSRKALFALADKRPLRKP